MKKNYIIPEIETLEVRSTFAICEGSDPDNNNLGNDSGNSSMNDAPRRRIF